MPDAATPGLNTSDIFTKTRRIEIQTSRLVNELFGGQYHSSFKGRGMEFADVREYIPGDDIRSIHWSITAKLGHPYIKRFTEERELTILIAVDVSASQRFGTRKRFKSELAAELIALLTFAAIKNNDKVGLLLFSDKIEEYIPPRKSKSHALRLIRDTLTFKPESNGTNISMALEYLNRVQKKKAIVFLLSDFIDAGFEPNLKITQRHHDTIAFVLGDPMEKEWPTMGRLLLQDAETNKRAIIPAGSKQFGMIYAKMANAERQALKTMFKKISMDHVYFDTEKDYVKPLIVFFQERAQRYRR